MTLLTMVIRNVVRRKLRSGLTIVAIALAIGAVVALVGIASGFERSFVQLYDSAGIDIIVVRSGVQERFNSVLDESIGKRLAAVPGVEEAIPSLVDMISFENENIVSVPLRGAPAGAKVIDHLQILSGRHLRPGDTQEIVLGKTVAEQLHKKVGDTVKLYDQYPYKVVGIYDAESLFDNGSLIIPIGDLQRLMERPNQVTGFTVGVVNPAEPGNVDRVVKAIDELKDDKGKSLALQALSARNHINTITQLQAAKAMSWVTSVIALVIGTVGVTNTMFMSVFERTREIGILRAIGWRPQRIVRLILCESLAMSTLGALVGGAGAVIATRLLAKVPMVAGIIDGRISPNVLALGFLLSIVVGLIGVAYPAFRGARIVPTAALRHE